MITLLDSVISWFSLCWSVHQEIHHFQAVFKWLSKVITWLRLLRLVIGLKDSCQFFNQWEAKPKPKPIAPCTCDFSHALSELQVIARTCDWFIVLFAPVVIGRSNCFGFGFLTVIWKPLVTFLIYNYINIGIRVGKVRLPYASGFVRRPYFNL